MSGFQSFFGNISNYFKNLSVSGDHIKAGSIVVLVFILVLLLAFFGRFMNKSTIKGIFVGMFFGFLLTLIIEGFLLLAGRTALTELLGWENAPKPVQTALDKGKVKLANVLGENVEIQDSYASEEQTAETAIGILQSLNPAEIKKVKNIICEP